MQMISRKTNEKSFFSENILDKLQLNEYFKSKLVETTL